CSQASIGVDSFTNVRSFSDVAVGPSRVAACLSWCVMTSMMVSVLLLINVCLWTSDVLQTVVVYSCL
ncbi:hypothetical protein OG21DRAFT_1512753, partial [Imleria badia]